MIMRPLVYIIGCWHDYQIGSCDKCGQGIIHALLRKIGALNKISVVFEEYSEEALAINGAASTIAQDYAQHAGVVHIFCDPETHVRNQLGILGEDSFRRMQALGAKRKIIRKTKRIHFDKREYFWIRLMKDEIVDGGVYILICGNDHVRSVERKLRRRGLRTRVKIVGRHRKIY